jgi:hypothetical protein
MRAPPEQGKPPPPLRTDAYGWPRPIGTIISRLTRPAFRGQRWVASRLLEEWAGIIGPALARETIPLKLSRGTLTIGCTGPVGLELQHLAPAVIGRITAYLGEAVVDRLSLVQHVAFRPPETAAQIAAPAAPFATDPPTDLEGALAALGRAVTRGASPPAASR